MKFTNRLLIALFFCKILHIFYNLIKYIYSKFIDYVIQTDI